MGGGGGPPPPPPTPRQSEITNVNPHAVDTYARRHHPSSAARRSTGSNAASDASTVIPMLAVVNASVVAVNEAFRVAAAGGLRGILYATD